MDGLGSISSMGIGLTVYLDDQFSKMSGHIHNNLERLGMDTDKFARGLRQMEFMGGMIERTGEAIVGFSKESLGIWTDFEDKINRTAVIAGIKKTDQGYKDLQVTAKTLSETYGILQDNIASAEVELAYAGKTVPEINRMTEAVVLLAKATNSPVEGANGTATMLVNIMQAYSAQSSEAMKYANIMTSAANRSTIEVKDLAESMRYSADVAVSAKIPFQEVASAIATLGNAGLRGSMAGTAYANMLRYIQTGIGIFGTKRQKTSLGILGLSGKELTDEQGHLIKLTQLLSLIKARTRGLGDNDKFSILQGIFGVRGNRAFGNLLNGMIQDAKGKWVSTAEAMQQGIDEDVKNGVTKSTALGMMQSLKQQEALLGSNWINFKQDWGKTLAPLALSLVTHLNKIVVAADHFLISPFGQWLVKFISASGVIEMILGKLLINGARFMGYLMTSAGSMKSAGEAMTIGARSAYEYLTKGAENITRAFWQARLQAQGISMYQAAGTGATMLRMRDARGRFVKAEEAGLMAKGLGSIFGAKGIGWGVKLAEWFKPMGEFFGFIGKSLGFLKIFGAVIGKVAGWLFGWEAMLIDLVSTLLTGKGLFEWLWEAIKWVGHNIFGLGKGDEKSVTTKERYHTNEDEHKGFIDRRSEREKSQEQLYNRERPLHINVTVNPTTGDKRTEKAFNLHAQRDMQNYSFEV